MPSRVKPRSYDNSRRQAAARETRRAIVTSAYELFLERGYGGTSLADVAAGAGVSVQTLYAQLGSKRALLKAVLDVAIAGDHEPVRLADREEVAAILAEPDLRRKMQLFAELDVTVGERVEPIDRVIRSAAAVDPEVQEQLRQEEQGRLAGMREFAEHLHEIGALRPDLGVEEAAQRIWAVHGPVLYRQLAVELRWPRQQVVDFVAELLVAALLPQKAVPRRR